MKIAMIFPGYGSQYVGMAKELYDGHRIIQEYFEEAANCLDINFVKLCFASSDAEITQTRNAYTSLFLVSTSLYALLKEMGIKPDVVAGYNQGEYAALFAGGGLNLPDGLYLLSKFAIFYDQALENMDVAALRIRGLKAKQIDEICKQATSSESECANVAMYERDRQQIVTGHTKALNHVRDLISSEYIARDKEVDIEFCSLGVGLHSGLMQPIIDQFRIYLNKVDFPDLSLPMIESVHGKEISKGVKIEDYIVSRIKSPLDWTRVMKKLAEYDLVIEVGPGTELSSWFKEQYPETPIFAINKQEDIQVLMAALPKKDDQFGDRIEQTDEK